MISNTFIRGTLDRQIIKTAGFFLVLIIPLCYLVSEVTRTEGLFSYDPYFHMITSEEIIESGDIPNTRSNTVEEVSIRYPSLLHPLMSVISMITGIDLLTLYQYVGPLSFVFLIASTFLLLRKMIGDKSSLYLGILLFSSFPYLLYRSTMALPETIAVSFMVLVFYSLLSDNRRLLLLVLVGGFCFHPRSSPLLFTLPLFYCLVPLLRVSLSSLKGDRVAMQSLAITGVEVLRFVIVFALLVLPLIGAATSVLSDLVDLHVGSTEWQEVDLDPAKYEHLDFSDYATSIGYPILVLALFGFTSLVKAGFTKEQTALLLGLAVMTFILTNSVHFSINIPPNRFLLYFGVALVIPASIGLNRLLTLKSNPAVKVIVLFLISVTLILNSTGALADNRGWQGYRASDLSAAEWVQNISDENVIIIPCIDWLTNRSINLCEARHSVLDALYACESSEQIGRLIQSEYGDSRVYLFILSSKYAKIAEKYPVFINALSDYQIVFQEGRTLIYSLSGSI